MKADRWTHSKGFWASSDACYADLERLFEASPPEFNAERLLKDLDALKKLTATALCLQDGENVSVNLEPARNRNGTPMQGYYFFKVKPWCSYYSFDPVGRIATGLLVFDERRDLGRPLKELLDEAIRAVRAER